MGTYSEVRVLCRVLETIRVVGFKLHPKCRFVTRELTFLGQNRG